MAREIEKVVKDVCKDATVREKTAGGRDGATRRVAYLCETSQMANGLYVRGIESEEKEERWD